MTNEKKLEAILPYLTRGDSPDGRYPDNNGEYWTLCPFHSDQHAGNFSVSERGYYCFVCEKKGSLDSLVEHLGVEFSDNGRGKKKGRFDFDNIVARYVYHDADGREVYQVWKDGNKEFLPTYMDGAKRKYGYPKSGRVLYHLPEVLQAETVFLVEGEKSANAVRALGLTATAIPGGAKAKWVPSYTEALTGRDVVIFPDHDDPGRKFANRARAILKGKASSVAVVPIPGLKERQDVEDYIKMGHGKADLLKLAASAPNGQEKKYPKTTDYIAALDGLGYQFRLNVCTDTVEVNREPISDQIRAEIRAKMRDIGYRRVGVMEDAYTYHAGTRKYHPVRLYLDGLKWDGSDHIDALACHFRDTKGYLPVFLRRWLIGAVARAYQKCQNRMLVLDGPQGIGKSYFCQWLAQSAGYENAFVESPICPENKDHRIRLISHWVWEVKELGATTRKADRDSLKSFLSLTVVTVRKPYGHYPIVKPALANFIGTINNAAGFLDDPTGHRRFMCLTLEGIDWGYTEAVPVDQVWAQAKAAYDAGETWELKGLELEMAEEANTSFEVSDPLEDLIFRRFEYTGDAGHFVPTIDILDKLHLDGWHLRTPRQETMEIGGLLRKLGLEATRCRWQGSNVRGYVGLRARPVPSVPTVPT